MTIEPGSNFAKIIDEMVDMSNHDQELQDGLQWLDKQAQKSGVTFYDMAYKVLNDPTLDKLMNILEGEDPNA